MSLFLKTGWRNLFVLRLGETHFAVKTINEN